MGNGRGRYQKAGADLRILDEWIEAAGVADDRADGAYVFAVMSGAVALSRSIEDPRLSDELLASMRAAVKGQLGL